MSMGLYRRASHEQINNINAAAAATTEELGMQDIFHPVPLRAITLPVLKADAHRRLYEQSPSAEEDVRSFIESEENTPVKVDVIDFTFYHLKQGSKRMRDKIIWSHVQAAGRDNGAAIDKLCIDYRIASGFKLAPPVLSDMVGGYGIRIPHKPTGILCDLAWIEPEADNDRVLKREKARDFVFSLRRKISPVTLSPIIHSSNNEPRDI